ncbi:MAG: sigma-70 family RNA polymerase sigma factor, partial [Planctomycetota bacterium]|nr:sigma-70 family RNA polymerase sigma factor [Planctomycetota bacterium]
MSSFEKTCWTLVQGAAAGDQDARSVFARTYLPVVRAYLGARWRRGPMVSDMDDAIQETFVECFREGGALERTARDAGRFRTYLFAIVRNVARRFEEKYGRDRKRRVGSSFDPDQLAATEDAASRVFDRAWAEALIKRAAERQNTEARIQGDAALRRVELMRLRFSEDMPIRDIAKLWDADAAALHREYAKAREEFKKALKEEVAFHHPGNPGEVERECAALLGLIS